LEKETYAENDLGERGFDRSYDDQAAAVVSMVAIGILVFLLSVLVPLTIRFVLPWLVPFVVDHARPLLGTAAALAVLALVDVAALRPLVRGAAAPGTGRRGVVILRADERR
jgi:hypothetical protein